MGSTILSGDTQRWTSSAQRGNANAATLRHARTGQALFSTRAEIEQLSYALLEPLFPVPKGIRLLRPVRADRIRKSRVRPQRADACLPSAALREAGAILLLAIGLTMIRGELGEEFVVGDTRGGC